MLSQMHRQDLTAGQHPFAIILGCSDSRVPAEIVFDQGLGDLFVIRVAGNIVAASQIGSVEFAVEQFNTPLVVVLGHSCCGAVNGTIASLKDPAAVNSGSIQYIVNRIRPVVESFKATDLWHQPDKLVEEAVRANVRASVNQLRYSSDILERRVESGKLMIVGAEYSLESGQVEFFEGISQ